MGMRFSYIFSIFWLSLYKDQTSSYPSSRMAEFMRSKRTSGDSWPLIKDGMNLPYDLVESNFGRSVLK